MREPSTTAAQWQRITTLPAWRHAWDRNNVTLKESAGTDLPGCHPER